MDDVTLDEIGCKNSEDFRNKCMYDLWFLNSVVLRHGKKIEYRDLNEIHMQLCYFLDFTHNPYPQKLVLMGRDTLKSTNGRGQMVQEFLKAAYHREEKLFGIYTGLTPLSQEHLKIISREILKNPLLQAYFYGIIPSRAGQADSWSKDKLRWDKMGIDIGSLGKSLTGMHYHGVWSDNIVNEQNSRTAELRRSSFFIWQQMESILVDNAWEVVNETPWESDDLSGRILDPDKNNFNYRSVRGKSPGRFMSKSGYDVFSCFARDEEGKLNFPEKLSERYLKRKQLKQGTYIYKRMYEGQVITDEKIQLGPKVIEHFRSLPKSYIRLMGVDCSGTKAKSSTESAITVGDWSPDSELFIDYAYKDKLSPLELFNKICEVYDNCESQGRPVTWVLVEREKYAIFLEDIMNERRPDIFIITVPLKGQPRAARHMRIVPLYEQAKVYSRKGLTDYEDEIKTWYRGKDTNCDIIDTVFLLVAEKFIPSEGTGVEEEKDSFLVQVERDLKAKKGLTRKEIASTF